MAERVALYLQDSHDLRDGLDYVRYAEEKGFEAVWQAESRLVRDAIVPMAAYAAVTTRLKVGSGVINNWTRNIGLLAATFLTLDDLAPNRIICGIGAWWDPLAKNVGIDRKKPLLAMRETVEVMRRLLNMERVTFHGEFHHVDGIELDVVHGRRLEGPHRMFRKGGDEHHGRAVRTVLQLHRDLQAGGAGHLDVEEERVHLGGAPQPGQDRGAILELPPHLAAGLPEQPGQAGSRQGLVIRQGQTQGLHRRVSNVARRTSATDQDPSVPRWKEAASP